MKKGNLLPAIISGLLLALSLPKPGIWVLAWVALVPLLVALRGSSGVRAAIYGLVTGIVYFGIILYPISLFGYLPWALLVIMQALYIAVFAFIGSKLLPKNAGWHAYVAIPAAWTLIQWLRSLGAFGLPWGSLAHTQANDLIVAQISSVTGPWGIDFLVCLVNLALAELILPYTHSRRWAPALVAALILTAVCVFGAMTLRSPMGGGRGVKVAVIQGNMPDDVTPGTDYNSAAFFRYAGISMRAERAKPDLIVWPETVIPTAITGSLWESSFRQLAAITHANWLIGAYDAPDDPSLPGGYNAAHLYGKNGKKLGVYRKVQLVPFGEFVPLRNCLPFLSRYRVRDVDVLPGAEHTLLTTNTGKMGVTICFESLFPQISRQETRRGANLLVVITNDAWFGQTQAARLHMMMAKLRAVENHRFVVRGADSGISAIIDPCGRTLKELDIFRQGSVSGEVRMLHGLTPYARFGDYFAYVCALASAVFLALSFRRIQPVSHHP